MKKTNNPRDKYDIVKKWHCIQPFMCDMGHQLNLSLVNERVILYCRYINCSYEKTVDDFVIETMERYFMSIEG